MIAAIFGILQPLPAHPEMATLAPAFILQGAICFLIGSPLMLPQITSTTDAQPTHKEADS